MAKDLFSGHADLYAKYRPVYPDELYNYILSFVHQKDCAWDCATGNGQAAVVLAGYFKKVFATDISAEQLSKAVRKENIEYKVCPAESTPFPENSFDLITVAQAYHWFKWDEFKKEVQRVAKPGAVIAVWMYGGHRVDDIDADKVRDDFYRNITYPYWEPERKLIDDNYANVAFEYELLPVKDFSIRLQWNLDEWLGYISTWSAVQKYTRLNGQSPIPLLEEKIKNCWKPGDVKNISFPITLKLGRVNKQ